MSSTRSRLGGTDRHAQRSSSGLGFRPQRCAGDIPADFAKVDSILRHLQQTESHDWVSEITHCATQVCYLMLQNYNIARLNFQNYNFHLLMLTTLFFAQRIWFFLWRVTQFSDSHHLRFACHLLLFVVLLDSLYFVLQLVIQDNIFASLYLAAPLLLSALFYHGYLKAGSTNVFTAELFSMLSRCVYHSLETAYCIGVLPLRFLRYEYIYYDTSRCVFLTLFVTAHVFLSFLCLELHCLGSEALQQTRMLGEWRLIPDMASRPVHKKPSEWSSQGCPYPRGAVVRCKGGYYEAMATLNTCSPASPSCCLRPVSFIFGDAQRAKAFMLAALLVLNLALVQLVLWNNQWIMYAVMLIPNALHFLQVKYRGSHSFFNPAHLNLNLRDLQWDLNPQLPEKPSSQLAGGMAAGRGFGADFLLDCQQRPDEADSLCSASPLFMSAVSASTMFFFGPGGASRYQESAPSQLRHEASGH